MALEFLKKKKKRKKAAAKKRWLTVAGFSTSLAFVTVLAFYSIEMAILAGGFLTLCAFITLDILRRQDWEGHVDRDIRTIKTEHQKLVREVMRNSDDISAIQEGISQAATTIETKTKDARFFSSPLSPETLKNMPKGDMFEKGPRAEKPQSDDKDMSAIVANDEDYSDYTDTVVRELIHHAVRNQRVDLFMQPIVRLPQRQILCFEMFARIRARAGIYLPAKRYRPLAEEEHLDTEIDNMLLAKCLETLKEPANARTVIPIFLNVKPGTLKHMPFMNNLLSFLARNRSLASRLVFEIRREDFEDLEPPLLKILRGLAQLGCYLSLDHCSTEAFDIAKLQKYKVRFIKLDANELVEKGKTDRGFTDLMRLKRKLQANGVRVIVEKIEDENMMRELLDYDFAYGQGYLFGRPDLQGAYRQHWGAALTGTQ